MKKFVYIMFIASLSTTGLTQTPEPKIINGVPGSVKDYPWIVNFNGCGGALISSQWVLTAAHCFNTDDNKAVNTNVTNRDPVILLTDNIVTPSAEAQTIPINEIIVHPEYNPATGFNNDIALIKLANPVTNPTVVTLMGNNEIPSNSVATVMGWGTTAINDKNESINPSPILLKTQQTILDQSLCRQIYAADGTQISDNMLCFNGVDALANSDTCQGDSGGPAVISLNNSFVQIGVVSFGGLTNSPPCGDPKVPGVYTRVASYQTWIKNYVADATFYTSASNNNCGTNLASNLDIQFNCVAFQNQVYDTNFVLKGSLEWEWSGSLRSSSCSIDPNTCATVNNDLSIKIPEVVINGQRYQATLRYSPEQGSKTWVYQSSSALN